MPTRSAPEFATLFESLIDGLRIEIAASVDRALNDFSRRLARIERRLDQLDAQKANGEAASAPAARICSLCERPAVARGFCSAHYQQWRYRERKSKHSGTNEQVESTMLVPSGDVADDN
jgi:hypothetical protein